MLFRDIALKGAYAKNINRLFSCKRKPRFQKLYVDVNILLFFSQELINRHLITMAQIDQADMPGKMRVGRSFLLEDTVILL